MDANEKITLALTAAIAATSTTVFIIASRRVKKAAEKLNANVDRLEQMISGPQEKIN